MKKSLLLVLVISIFVFINGCGPKVYDNANPNADWDRDNFMCRSYAEGNTPMPQMVPVPQTETVTGTGTVYYNDGQSAPFTYTQTYQPNQYQQLGANMQNASASWGRIAMLQERYEECLSHLGWHEHMSNDSNSSLDEDDIKLTSLKSNAQKGDINSQVALANEYLHGEKIYSGSIKRDRMNAYAWFGIAAKRGDKIAQYEIGKAYLSGEDLEKNIAEGKKYLEMSAAQGYQPAVDVLKELK